MMPLFFFLRSTSFLLLFCACLALCALCAGQAVADTNETAAVFVALGGYVKALKLAEYDFFGHAVAISGDTAIVGAPQESGCGRGVFPPESVLLAGNDCTHSGAAYMLERNHSTGTWTHTAYIKAPNARRFNTFGFSVAISGDSAIIGAPGESGCRTGVLPPDSWLLADTTCSGTGAVYALSRDRSTGTWAYTSFIRAPNAEADDNFGRSVAMSGDYAIVGAPFEDGCGRGVLPLTDSAVLTDNLCPQSGAAYILKRNITSGAWAHAVYIKAPNAGAADIFSTSVAIEGGRAIIGAHSEDGCGTGVFLPDSPVLANISCRDTGAAYLLERNTISGAWAYTAYVKAPNAGVDDYFGRSLAISGDRAVIGATLEDGCGTGVLALQSLLMADNSCFNNGAAYMLERNSLTGTWVFTAYIKALNPLAVYSFGSSVAISGDHAIVATYKEDGCGMGVYPPDSPALANISCYDSGAAYLLERNSSTDTWAYTAYIKAPNADANDNFGYSVAIIGDRAMIGATYEDGCGTGIVPLDSVLLTNKSCIRTGAAYIWELAASSWPENVPLTTLTGLPALTTSASIVLGPNFTVGVPMMPCDVSSFNETAFAEQLAVAYAPEFIINPADVVIIEAQCTGDILEITFAIRGTSTGVSVPLPPPLTLSGDSGVTFNGTTWSIISWPGYTTTGEPASAVSFDEMKMSGQSVSHAFLPASLILWALLAGLALLVTCLIVAVVLVLRQRRRAFKNNPAPTELPMVLPDPHYEPLSASHYDSLSASSSVRPAVYTAEKMIGSGQFGNVYSGVTENGAVVALKELSVDGMSATDLAEMKREAMLLEKCQHECVVEFFGIIDRHQVASGSQCDALSNGVFMVMALCEFGDLRSAIQRNQTGDGIRYDSVSVLVMAEQAARGMAFLHSQKVVHRDLALRNLLVGGCAASGVSALTMADGSPCRVLISDFGLGRMLGNDYAAYYSRNEGQLPIRWTAPEAVLKGRYGRESDVYAFGVTICELVSGGQQPFSRFQPAELVSLFATEAPSGRKDAPSFVVAEVPSPFLLPWSNRPIFAELWELALACCAMNSSARPTFAAVADLLKGHIALRTRLGA